MRIFQYIIPLFIIPYLVKTLGFENFGIYSFALAFMGYFLVITNYGFDLSATRSISLNRGNQEYINTVVSAVLLIKLVISFICFTILILLIVFVEKFNNEAEAYLVAFIFVLGNVLFPIWFFHGIERIRNITLMNITIKTIILLLIFVFVKNEDDYIVALLINSLSQFVPAVISIVVLKIKYKVVFKIVSFDRCITMLREGWHIFISSFLGNIMASSGTVVLGFISSNTIVGIYSSIEKVIRAIVGLFNPVTQALFPFMSAKFAQDHQVGVKIVKKVAILVMGIGSVFSLLIIAFSSNILNLIYGQEIADYSLIMQFLVFWLWVSILNNIIGYQYLLASGQEKLYSSSFIKAGLVTIILYIILAIPYSMYGVVAAMLVGESLLTVLMCSSIRKKTFLKRS